MTFLYLLILIVMCLIWAVKDEKARGVFQIVGLMLIILNVAYVLGIVH